MSVCLSEQKHCHLRPFLNQDILIQLYRNFADCAIIKWKYEELRGVGSRLELRVFKLVKHDFTADFFESIGFIRTILLLN